MKIEVLPLPYSPRALAPWLSARTLDEHYEKHHKGYLKRLNKLIRGKPEEKLSLEELIRTRDGHVFENAAQVWNHNFYWRCMRPEGGGRPDKELVERLVASFGSLADFKRRFAEAATGRFGSGWAWLTQAGDGASDLLRIESTADADNPLERGAVPLLVIDVWEHAYYLDYKSERERYVKGFVDHLIDWDFVLENLAATRARTELLPNGEAVRIATG